MQASHSFLLLACLLRGVGSVRLRVAGNTGRYLISSFPRLRQINYAQLPDTTWRPLVITGLGKPQLIAVDNAKHRLFVVDELSSTLVWYQLRRLPSGRLMTDGHQHPILQSFVVRGLALDVAGGLFIAGRRVPPAPELPFEGIFKLDAAALDASIVGGFLLEPLPIWTRNNTASLNAPQSPRLNEPIGLAVDPLNLFWGNAVIQDSATGVIVKAALTPPVEQPGESVAVLDAGTQGIVCLAATPSDLYYVMGGKIYGIPKDVTGLSCGESAASCGVEVGPQKLNVTLTPKMMVFDGEGTMYLSDQMTGAIYSFASGSLNKHYLTKVADALDAWGLALYVEVSAAAAKVVARTALLAMVTLLFVGSAFTGYA